MSDIRNIDKNMPILIVDDFSTMRRIMRNALKLLGFENVTEASDGSLAWDKMQKSDFQFIVSDWNMPNMMGVDLLKTARSSEKYKSIPFMIVAPETQKENLNEAEQAGVSTYIVKPFTAAVLKDKMEAIF